MERFASHQPVNMQMGLQVQIPQRRSLSTHPTSTMYPDNIINPHNQDHKNDNGKRDINEINGRDREDDDNELLFDIDEFLEEEDALIRPSSSIVSEDAEGATITEYSPTYTTNTSPNSSVVAVTESTRGKTEDQNPTNTTAIMIDSHSSSDTNSTILKKRKKRYRSKSKNNVNAPPKRPLSAYNLYFREERKRCVAENTIDPESSSKKYSFEELGKLIGRGWRSLPVKQKQELEARAEADRERYRIEMIAYRCEKRRKNRKEDEDNLIIMRQQHQNHGHIDICPHSPTVSVSPRPARVCQNVMIRRHTPGSPGRLAYAGQRQQGGDPQDEHFPHQEDANSVADNTTTMIPHVRKVSLSGSTPPHLRRDSEYRSRNNSSPAVSSYGSCSSWSGDDCEDGSDDHRGHRHKRMKDDLRGRDVSGCEVRTNRATGAPTSITTKITENPQTPSNSPRPHPRISHPESGTLHTSAGASTAPVARVVAMPSTAVLERILRDGTETLSPHSPHARRPQQQSPSPPPSPPPPQQQAWTTSYGHPHYVYHQPQHHHHHHHQYEHHQHPHYHHQHPYAALSSPMTSDDQTYSMVPPPPQAFSAAPTTAPHQHSTLPPQMLPLGMEMVLWDPSTGRDRSYRVIYTPKYMTLEEANQFQQTQSRNIHHHHYNQHSTEEQPQILPTHQHVHHGAPHGNTYGLSELRRV